MEISQLKSLAGRVRDLLQQSSSIIGHNQALDVIASLPGLRNWPEVVAFPDRVAACELNVTSAARLAFRLRRTFALDYAPTDLLSALAPTPVLSKPALQVWPGGPPSGVYVTTSTKAIDALLARYDEATDGGVTYTEHGGRGDSSIDLGENGLWSSGIDRLPSGTLLVVGPVNLDQESWNDAAERLAMACIHALDSDHRVAVLVDTPMPVTLCEDVVTLLGSTSLKTSEVNTALIGLVTDDGELQLRRPFATGYPKPVEIHGNIDIEAFPAATRGILRRELSRCTAGIVLFGSSEIVEHSAAEQVAAALSLTNHAGPAARILPRHRGTPAKDRLVPEAINALPFLPSIQSAYAQGYRRMVITPHYSRAETLLAYDDVLFLGGTYEHDVASIVLRLIAGRQEERAFVDRIIAVLGLFKVSSRRGQAVACDLFVRGDLAGPAGTAYEEIEAYLRDNRVIRWQDELVHLLDSGAATVAGIKKTRGHYMVSEFLAHRRSIEKAATNKAASKL